MTKMFQDLRSCRAAALYTGVFSLIAAATSQPALAQAEVNRFSGAVTVGCPFVASTTAERNTGYLDENATYAIAQIPLNPPAADYIRIRGTFPSVRYWSIQSYEGATAGNFIDALADARISNTSGAVINTNVAELPTGGKPGDPYTLTVRYQAPPAAPLMRAPNTLYAGVPTTTSGPNRVAKQLIYRIYMPNPGTGPLGNQPLPRLTYVSSTNGEIPFENTPDTKKCERIRNLSTTTTTVNPGIFPNRNIRFTPVSRTADRVLYPNGDSDYLRAAAALRFGDMVVVRAKRQRAPLLPPLVEPAVDSRYLSLCQYELGSSAVVSCFTDRGLVVQGDDYAVYVMSTLAKRPPGAVASNGYNWLPWGSTANELLVLRQILPKPNFAGDYRRAAAQPEAPLTSTLGLYAPQISYCDTATFTAFAASGGAALLSACQFASAR